ncbi:MAG: hypothetical protein LBG60_08065, partial [Bifidobacteriaceae bacterium]|nr:hypothetical protein [Bifidobacteriaceae bacterium]
MIRTVGAAAETPSREERKMVATAELSRPTAPEPCAPGRLGRPGDPARWLRLACACQQAGLPEQQVRHAQRVLDLVPAVPPQPPRTGPGGHLELRLRASALVIGGLAAGGKRGAAAAALKARLAELAAAGQGERAEVEAFAGLALYGIGGGDTAHRLRAALAWAAEYPDLGELEAEAALALA